MRIESDKNILTHRRVSGIPNPAIVWRYNGAVLSSRPGLRVMNDNQQIEIPNVEVDDAGQYSCTATNDAGTATRTHTVIVRGKLGALLALNHVSLQSHKSHV